MLGAVDLTDLDMWARGVPYDLLMAIGSLRTFAHAPHRGWLVASAVLGIGITAGAIYGSFCKVTSPTILAPWFALAVLVIGFASTRVTKARRPARSQVSDLAARGM
jgi:hypothetical protein